MDDLNCQIVEMLVKNGRLANEIDAVTSSTPLHVAARIGNPALTGTLISRSKRLWVRAGRGCERRE